MGYQIDGRGFHGATPARDLRRGRGGVALSLLMLLTACVDSTPPAAQFDAAVGGDAGPTGSGGTKPDGSGGVKPDGTGGNTLPKTDGAVPDASDATVPVEDDAAMTMDATLPVGADDGGQDAGPDAGTTQPSPCLSGAAGEIDGDVTLGSQAEVDMLAGVVRIDGSLVVREISPGAVQTLEPLSCLAEITDGLAVVGNRDLTDLKGLEGLAGVTALGSCCNWGITLEDNASLLEISALAGVRQSLTGVLRIAGNGALSSLGGLSGIDYVDGHIEVVGNAALPDLEGLEGLERAGSSLYIGDNAQLVSVDGLENLQDVSYSLDVSGNPSLADLDGFAGLTLVGGGVFIYENASLPTCAAESLVIQVGTVCQGIDYAGCSFGSSRYGRPCSQLKRDVTCVGDCACTGNMTDVCSDPAYPLLCDDGKKNGAETGVDCGGSCPNACGSGLGCVTGADCVSTVCDQGLCAPRAVGQGCTQDSDCATNTCIQECDPAGACVGRCRIASCDNHRRDGAETGYDCGGPDCQPCACTVQGYSYPEGWDQGGSCFGCLSQTSATSWSPLVTTGCFCWADCGFNCSYPCYGDINGSCYEPNPDPCMGKSATECVASSSCQWN